MSKKKTLKGRFLQTGLLMLGLSLVIALVLVALMLGAFALQVPGGESFVLAMVTLLKGEFFESKGILPYFILGCVLLSLSVAGVCLWLTSRYTGHITDTLQDENLLVIAVDNSANETVYPQMADFTFYGGLYRDVNIVAVSESHFNLDYYGGPGIKVTPVMNGADAKVSVEVFVDNKQDDQVIRYTLLNAQGEAISTHETGANKLKTQHL